MTLKERFVHSDFYRVFNFKDKSALVRSLILLNVPFASFAGAVTTGALYTVFLAEQGIDIVRVGILSIIPLMPCGLTVFGPWMLSRFKKRQHALLLNYFILYTATILGTTVFPFLVDDPGKKTLLLAVCLLAGHTSNALLGSGYQPWLSQHLPKGKDINTFTAYSNLTSQICTNGMGVVASVIATALAKTGQQLAFVTTLRVVAYTAYIAGILMLYLIPKEEPITEKPAQVSPWHMISVPMKTKSFMLVLSIPILYNLVSQVNSGTYGYYLLETLHMPIFYQNIPGIAGLLAGIFLSNAFRRVTNRTSPYWMVALGMGLYAVMEVCLATVGSKTVHLYAAYAVFQGVINVAFTMGFNSLFYLALPEGKNKDLYAAFWNMVCCFPTIVGSSLGTALIAALQKVEPISFLGLSLYGSQVLCLVKAVLFALLSVYMFKMLPRYPKERLEG